MFTLGSIVERWSKYVKLNGTVLMFFATFILANIAGWMVTCRIIEIWSRFVIYLWSRL